MHFSSPEKRIWLVTDAYAIVVSLQAPIYFRFLALVSFNQKKLSAKIKKTFLANQKTFSQSKKVSLPVYRQA